MKLPAKSANRFMGRILPGITGLLLLAGIFFSLTGCGRDTPSPSSSPASRTCRTTPESAFQNLFNEGFSPVCPVTSGSGSHGTWQTDSCGAPAFRYTINQYQDPRALYFTSWGSSHDHWHQLGNNAVTATAHNDGYVQFWDWSRGGKCINRFQPERNNLSGGFRFLKVDDEVWHTLYNPADFERYERLFGTGFFRKETLRNGLEVIETTYAPFGDDAILISETEVWNRSPHTREIVLYEVWDFNLYELLLAPIMTAPLGEIFEWVRWAFNNFFQVSTRYDPEQNLLVVLPTLVPGVSVPARDEVSINDFYPYPCFLACLKGSPDFYYTDQEYFFGDQGPDRPRAIVREDPSLLLPEGTGEIHKACLVFGERRVLEPGEKASVAYAFGYGPLEAVPALLDKYREDPDQNFNASTDAWIGQRADLVTSRPESEWLRREVLWHSYYLPAGAFYEDYFQGPVVNQGSAYGYIQGMNGAHRDFALFALPLVYLRPELARDVIRYTLRSQDYMTGKIPYAHQGYGFASGFLVHEESTDLDLFLLMAVAEYLGATRDFGFLDEVLPYYPLSSGSNAAVREHLTKALDHLENEVGEGPNGLIRAGSGDWNDVLIAFSPHPVRTMTQGESNFNTSMACYLFPRLAELLETHMPDLSGRLAFLGQKYYQALQGEWTGQWMRRGYLGDGTWLGEDKLFLDAQAWPLLAGLWDAGKASTLLGNIEEMLVTPSPAGALCLYPSYPAPLVPGSDTNGGTWAAVDSWLAWAWSLYEPDKAWEFFLKTTLHRHAEVYPDIWYGIWSGPDSYNAYYAERPGETFNWSFTPMTDFPVMNMNRHSGPLLDVIRMAGIDPLGDRIEISPKVPFTRYSLRLPLLGLAYLDDQHRGYYRPMAEGVFNFRVRLPAGLSSENCRLILNGTGVTPLCLDGHLEFEAAGKPGDTIQWEILPAGK